MWVGTTGEAASTVPAGAQHCSGRLLGAASVLVSLPAAHKRVARAGGLRICANGMQPFQELQQSYLPPCCQVWPREQLAGSTWSLQSWPDTPHMGPFLQASPDRHGLVLPAGSTLRAP